MIRFLKCSLVLVISPALCFGQVVGSLESTGVLPGNGENSIISDIESNEGQEQFLDWSSTLGDFSDIKTVTQEELEAKMARTSAKMMTPESRNVCLNGKVLELPSVVDDNGIDLYMLTDEGISIYMALLAPVFYQETTEDIKKWIRFYAYDNRARTEKMFDRYSKWDAYIRGVFSSKGVPEELAVLCMVESACTYSALSPAGARGMWQIIPSTARQWGLTVNESEDDRLDPLRSTEVAASIFRWSYRKMPEWTLCVAGYNCGMGRVERIVSERYGNREWLQIKDRFPKETRQYVPSLLAVYYVWSYREKLGFGK